METGEHLARCLVYIGLNMVRAGVVRHPDQWGVKGYHEIQAPPVRYRVVDREAFVAQLKEQLGIRALDRTVTVDDDAALLAEDPAPYAPVTPPKSSLQGR